MWKFIQAQSIGSAHLNQLTPYQDRLWCDRINEDVFLGIIADGAGSAKNSQIGASIAVALVSEFVGENLSNSKTNYLDILKESVFQVRKTLEDEANLNRLELREYASTLLIALLVQNTAYILQIGDGVIILNNDNNDYDYAFWPQNGEYINTTCFITDTNLEQNIQLKSLSNIYECVLMSDGLQALALDYARNKVHKPFMTNLIKPLAQCQSKADENILATRLLEFIISDRVKERTDDDISIILACYR